ncbi:hypothetical protein PENCOP_c009G01038 [Penicillium coprophilum]|uniref:Uncharacterized protein n=1 Tax=Penicillium coprophilum TaxID=36646 RepID=A0A1V6UHJ5_9EURO|nr:hypothetical protein PENCOP_c009G01038 [Penicillium coprophilum]
MRFYSLTFILVAASASLGLAAPLDMSNAKTLSTDSLDAVEWTCDKDWNVCGVCNGSSCKIAGINTDCKHGSCGGPKGGDGKHCGWKHGGDTHCPPR